MSTFQQNIHRVYHCDLRRAFRERRRLMYVLDRQNIRAGIKTALNLSYKIRIIFFLTFSMLIARVLDIYSRRDLTKELQRCIKEWGFLKFFVNRDTIPNILQVLPTIKDIWFLKVKQLSKYTPRYFIISRRFIGILSRLNAKINTSMSSGKRKHLCFSGVETQLIQLPPLKH